jgi:histidinol-phosphatase (PHP family)
VSNLILHDQHVHSQYSEDSEALLDEYYEFAKKLGCKYFVTTEHIDFMPAYSDHDWICDFDLLKTHLDSLNQDGGPQCLLGIEMGYRKDYLNQINNYLNLHNYDLINLSIHDNGKLEYYFIEAFEELGLKKTMQVYYEQILDAVTTIDKFNVLSHIDYGFKTALKIDKNYDFFSDKEILEKILTILIKKGKALEINVKVQRYMTKEHLRELLNFYKSLGGTKVTLSSDSHKVETYLNYFDEYKEIIKSCGFNYLCYYIKQIEYHFDI